MHVQLLMCNFSCTTWLTKSDIGLAQLPRFRQGSSLVPQIMNMRFNAWKVILVFREVGFTLANTQARTEPHV